MKVSRLSLGYGAILALGCALSGAFALASTPLTISATNVTVPSSSVTHSIITVIGIPAAGNLSLACQYSGPATNAELPTCSPDYPCLLPPGSFPVTPGQTFTGLMSLIPYGLKPPICLEAKRNEPQPLGHLPSAGLGLASALILGFGLRHKAQRWLVLALLAAGALVGLAGVSGCGGSNSNTYQYTITANYLETGSSVPQIVSTTIEVTVQ